MNLPFNPNQNQTLQKFMSEMKTEHLKLMENIEQAKTLGLKTLKSEISLSRKIIDEQEQERLKNKEHVQ